MVNITKQCLHLILLNGSFKCLAVPQVLSELASRPNQTERNAVVWKRSRRGTVGNVLLQLRLHSKLICQKRCSSTVRSCPSCPRPNYFEKKKKKSQYIKKMQYVQNCCSTCFISKAVSSGFFSRVCQKGRGKGLLIKSSLWFFAHPLVFLLGWLRYVCHFVHFHL